MAKYIMLQGTSSHVGKSIIATALCRIFFQERRRVVPFKAQNMALNSYVTKDGKEMGRAQVAQAEAAGMDPQADMNPVLLKPTGDCCSQVIIDGRSVGNMSAKDYHKGYSLTAFSAVKSALARLDKEFEVIVIEGAGSPAEINLKEHDIVNMRVAKYAKSPVLLIADIDRGGSLAALVGTLDLLDETERALVKGLVINKFRGDETLLAPAVRFLEQKTGKPVLGIIPFIDHLGIDDEDSVSLEEKKGDVRSAALKLAVIQVPKISNFTDFDSLAQEPDVSLYYVNQIDELGQPDLILLPGSKNTMEDMIWLNKSGLGKAIAEHVTMGRPVVGICGGYQMLGGEICDPDHTESSLSRVNGLGLLSLTTTFAKEKMTSQVMAICTELPFLGQIITDNTLQGYEIHMGHTVCNSAEERHPIAVTKHVGNICRDISSTARADGLVWGTYIHGIFDNNNFRRAILNCLRLKKGMEPRSLSRDFSAEKQKNYDRLADVVRTHLDMKALRQIMERGIV